MDHPVIPSIRYDEFIRDFSDRITKQRIPANGSIEVTARCNLRCAHCYINLPSDDHKAQEKEMTSHRIYHILEQMADEGCLWLLLTGGEPFIRPDFTDIYKYAKNKGMLITLFTNGTLITPEIADFLAEWPAFSIEITMYGRTRETYEEVTNTPGSYDRFMRAIYLLLERKLPLKLKTMALTLNKHEIDDMKQFSEDLGVAFRFDPILNLRVDGNRRPAGFRISAEEVVALDITDEKRMKQWHTFSERFSKPPQHPEYLYQCGAGQSTFHIDHYGNMSACMMARKPSFNVCRGRFKEGWYNFMPAVLAQKRMQQTQCGKCKLISLCNQCPGFAMMENHDQEMKVDYLCRITHMRAEAFGLNRTPVE
jgi:radical SAM protein with 4Fe4S-binding SPASM domain